MKRSQKKLPLRTLTKARPLNSTTQWAAGGQNTPKKMTPKQQKLMAQYLQYLEKNRKQ